MGETGYELRVTRLDVESAYTDWRLWEDAAQRAAGSDDSPATEISYLAARAAGRRETYEGRFAAYERQQREV